VSLWKRPKDDQARTSKITYFVYGYFKEKVDFPLKDPVKFRAEVLAYTKSEKEKRVTKNIADDLGLSLLDIEGFLSRLKFDYTKKYDPHKEAVIDALKQAKGCSIDEAKSLYYPNAFTLISDLATKPSAQERIITKAQLINRIDSKRIIFHHWLLREKDEDAYCRTMRRSFFTQTNVSPFARFFSVECLGSESVHELKDLMILIGSKWSSSRKVRLEFKFRYAPYILLRNCDPAKLTLIKSELFGEGCCFVDGYPFGGSGFTAEHIHSEQTNENRIALRILNDDVELQTALNTMLTRSRQLYEFFKSSQLTMTHDIKHVRIPITSISLVSNII